MRTGGSYTKDPKTGEIIQVARPTESHPDGDGARDSDGTLIGGFRIVGETGPEIVTAVFTAAKAKGKTAPAEEPAAAESGAIQE